jgi:predicted glycosyltransferase
MTRESNVRPQTVWIDLDNSPHVPFFAPIIRELEKQGHTVVVTTRDCFQVRGLADHHRLNYKQVGRHYGANKVMKVLGTIWRAVQLAPTVLAARPAVSLSHGSRPLVLLSALLGIRTILLFDYEHARTLPFVTPELGMAPEAIANAPVAKHFRSGLRVYPGLKEDVYVASFQPDPSIFEVLGLSESDILAVLRPPATEAHYHNPDAEVLFVEAVNFLAGVPGVRMVILPRNEVAQGNYVRQTWPELCQERRIIIPERVVDGLNLIWHSDLVISGGGTMNREAAALGVPVYSIFRGKMGAVDQYLSREKRLTLIETPADIRAKIRPVKRDRSKPGGTRNLAVLNEIIAATSDLLGRPPRSVRAKALQFRPFAKPRPRPA